LTTLALVLLPVLQLKAPPVANLKTAELAGKYTIQVPDYLTVRRISDDHVASVPTYIFNATPPHHTTIHVLVKAVEDVFTRIGNTAAISSKPASYSTQTRPRLINFVTAPAYFGAF
jgi:hypothetical protein